MTTPDTGKLRFSSYLPNLQGVRLAPLPKGGLAVAGTVRGPAPLDDAKSKAAPSDSAAWILLLR